MSARVIFHPLPELWPESFTDAIAIDAAQDKTEITELMIEISQQTAGVPHFRAKYLHVFSSDAELIRVTVEKLTECGYPFIHCHYPKDENADAPHE